MHEPSLSSPEQTDLRQYRDVSRLAIVALVLGLLSPAALAHPLLWIVPIAGAVVAAGAIINLGLRDQELTGRRLAICGLVLCLFFGSWSIGQVSLRGWLLQAQAQSLADHWLSLWKSGEFEQAHQLAMSVSERRPEGTDLKRFYPANPQAANVLQSFSATPPNRWLKQMHEQQGTFVYRGLEHHAHPEPGEDRFVLLYDIHLPGEAGGNQYPVQIHLARIYYEGSDLVDWYVEDTSDPRAKSL